MNLANLLPTYLLVNFLALSLLPLFLVGCGGGSGSEVSASPRARQQIFVSPSGSDQNSGAEQSPLLTINSAVAIATPGDSVILRAGRYRELVRINTSGVEASQITYAAFSGERVVIDGGGVEGQDAVVVSGSWIVLRNLEIENAGNKGLLITSNNNLVEGVVSHHNRGSGIQVFGGSNNLLSGCIAHSNADPVNGGENADGFSLGGENNAISNCRAFDNSDDGFDAWNSRHVVIESSLAYRNGSGPRGDGNGFKLSNLADGNTVAVKNIAYWNSTRGFTNNGGGGQTFFNNTAWQNPVNFQSSGSLRNEFINNLSVDGRLDLSSSAEQNSNSWNLAISNGDFLSIDPNSPDFLAPTSTSPVIDRGIDVGLPYTGLAPDLGAIEENQ